MAVGKRFSLKLEVVLTDGSEPIGKGIGPVLEMIDVIKVLKREDFPKDLSNKSVFLAGKLLELSEIAKIGEGEKIAADLLESKKAFEKFKEIISAQKGKIIDLKPGNFSFFIKSIKNSKILHIDNKLVNKLARVAGCPEDKKAGVYLNKIKGDIVNKGDILMTIYAVSEEKLKQAINIYNKNKDGIFDFE